MSDVATDPTAAFRLDGRVVMVTGASSGLGERFARVAAAAGAEIVVAARRSERLEALVDELGSGTPVPVDLTTADGPQRLVDAALEVHGRIDVLVNNAGSSEATPALDYEPDALRAELELNLVAPYALARLVARSMVDARRQGCVVNVGSVLGTVGGGRLRVPGYAAAKGGLHQLTRELASEWARRGIRVNALAPAWFESEMTRDAMFGTDGGRAYIEEGTPMGRAGRVDELDGAFLFLAADASSYVTGHVLHVDGGWTAV
ncbi:MAG: SDR family oxidoreductase [Actinomycetota bacterium]